MVKISHLPNSIFVRTPHTTIMTFHIYPEASKFNADVNPLKFSNIDDRNLRLGSPRIIYCLEKFLVFFLSLNLYIFKNPFVTV